MIKQYHQTWGRFSIKYGLTCIEIPITNTAQPKDHLIFRMRIRTLIRPRLLTNGPPQIYPPSHFYNLIMEFLPDSNTVYTSGDTRIFSQSHPPPLINEHKHPFGFKNPKFQCFFFNSVLQLVFSIFRNNSNTSPFNSSTEGSLLKCLFQTAHNVCNSKDVDALKFQLVHDTFYNGQKQQDSTECLLMLKNIIHKGSMPDSSSTTSPMGASLSDILFSFVLENILSAMYVDWGPPHLSPVVCHIFHLLTPLLCKTWF